MKLIHLYIILTLSLSISLSSCVDDLDVEPVDEDIKTSERVFDSAANYKQALSKLYAGYSLTGQEGPAGNRDIASISDEGFSGYMRQYFTHQVLPTDEAVVGWGDEGLREFNYHSWGTSNQFVNAIYSRVYFQIAQANEFIRNVKGAEDPALQTYFAEARFVRALSYWHALDMFGGGIPFVQEDDPVGFYNPPAISADSLMGFIETELKQAAENLPAQSDEAYEYGRASKSAAWTVLAKLYLNAEVYTGEARYDEALEYINRVIDQKDWQLESNYDHLFRADNHTANGVIFAITCDGTNSQSYANTTFIINAASGGDMDLSERGNPGNGWGGHRTTPQFVSKFPSDSSDNRAMFFTENQSLEVDDIASFQSGYGILKFKNITFDGQQGSNATFADTDFPMFRIADVYLMYAECVLRGASEGSMGQAVDYINQLRERAYGNADNNITASQLNLNFLLDERARELYWEGHRRTDLIRFGKFTGSDYVWSWKGQVQEGAGTSDFRSKYPIPASETNVNPNIKQNEGY